VYVLGYSQSHVKLLSSAFCFVLKKILWLFSVLSCLIQVQVSVLEVQG